MSWRWIKQQETFLQRKRFKTSGKFRGGCLSIDQRGSRILFLVLLWLPGEWHCLPLLEQQDQCFKSLLVRTRDKSCCQGSCQCFWQAHLLSPNWGLPSHGSGAYLLQVLMLRSSLKPWEGSRALKFASVTKVLCKHLCEMSVTDKFWFSSLE